MPIVKYGMIPYLFFKLKIIEMENKSVVAKWLWRWGRGTRKWLWLYKGVTRDPWNETARTWASAMVTGPTHKKVAWNKRHRHIKVVHENW